jgi:hypothetical protein
MPELWGQLQWDLPQYTTTGQVRQLDFGGAPQITAPQYGVPRAEQAFYQRGASRLDPQQASEQQSLEIKMRNQGLTPGDEAWKSQMQDLNQRQNDARQALMNETIMAGGREAERMFGMESGYRGQITDELMGLGQFANQAAMNEFQQNMAAGTQQWKNVQQAAQFQNQARQQKWQERQAEANYYNQLRQAQMNEYLTQRGFTLNEIQALLNNQQVGMPQFNQFTNASKADTPQLLQAAMLQGQQNAANSSQENAWMNSLMGGAGQAAGMFAMFSDRRLKTNIRKIGERKGVNWYAYEIFGRPQIGVMADEVPWAAIKHPSGYYAVDYARI